MLLKVVNMTLLVILLVSGLSEGNIYLESAVIRAFVLLLADDFCCADAAKFADVLTRK